MAWEAVAAVAGVVSALAVAVTVIYLAKQVRDNTTASRAQTLFLLTSELGNLAANLAGDPQITRVYRIGLESPGELDENEKYQFALLAISQFRRYENLHYQYQKGLVDEEVWEAYRENLLWFFHRPGTQIWWPGKRMGFTKSFRDFLESSNADDLVSPDTRNT